MTKHLQVRDIPEPLHRELKRRAEAKGETLTELRENVSAYDATYVALAERLGAALLTADRKLARAVRRMGVVRVLP